MTKEQSFNVWRSEIMAVRDPNTFTEAQRFSALLDEVEDDTSYQVGCVLFDLLSDQFDHGLKQSVVRLLSGFPVYTYYCALLSNFGRLVGEASKREWPQITADYLGWPLEQKDIASLLKAFEQAEQAQKNYFLKVVTEHDFFHEYAWPAMFLAALESKEKRNGV